MAKNENRPAFYLVVMNPFGDYVRGSEIKDAAEIDKVLNSENINSVNKVYYKD